jgi:uncharacterized protein YciI
MYYILFYETVDDYVEKRQAYRTEHLALAKTAVDNGSIVMAGAFANPADGAAFVFKADAISIVEDFAKADPYVQNGLVSRWYVREWTVVVGG